MLLCQRAGLEFAPLDLFAGTAWLPFPMFGRARCGTENVATLSRSSGRAMASATFSATARPINFGACSPSTMCNVVMIENAIANAIP